MADTADSGRLDAILAELKKLNERLKMTPLLVEPVEHVELQEPATNDKRKGKR